MKKIPIKQIFIASVVLTLIIARAQDPHAKILKALAAKSSSGVTNIYADFSTFFNTAGSNVGLVYTLAMATNVSDAFIKGPWLFQAGNAPQSNTNLIVGTNHVLAKAPFFVDGSLYSGAESTNAMRLTNAHYQFISLQSPNPGPTNSCCFDIYLKETGATAGFGFNLGGFECADIAWVEWIDDTVSGSYWTVETSFGGSAQHVSAVGLTNCWWHITEIINTNLGQVLALFYTNSAQDGSGTSSLVGSSSNHMILSSGGGGITFDIGRQDVHGIVPASVFDFGMAAWDWTYAHFPLGPAAWTNSWSPVISSIAVPSASTTGATITWITDHTSGSKVVYGTTSAYGTTQDSAELARSHTVTLSGLTGNQLYHYAVVSTNGANLTSQSSDNTFTANACGGNLKDSFSTVGSDYNENRNYIATKFVANCNATTDSVRFKLKKLGGGANPITFKIWSDSGGNPATTLGTSSQNVLASALIASYADYTLALAGVSLTAGTTYWVGCADAATTFDFAAAQGGSTVNGVTGSTSENSGYGGNASNGTLCFGIFSH